MNECQDKVKLTEAKFKNDIDKRITGLVDKANSARAAYEKVERTIGDLTASIKSMASKFDTIKDSMESFEKSKKQNEQEIETHQLQQRLLSTEIENFQNAEAKK